MTPTAPILALGFLNPLLLWALPLAAVPIIIHLLNRRRFQRRPWAAMEFLLRAMKKSRRRLRMEQWLILLLRTLAVLLLVLLVARPSLQGGGLFGGSSVHHVVVVDDSASMAARSGAEAAFDRARDTVRGHARALAETRSGDRYTLLRASRPDAPDLDAVPVSVDLDARIRDVLATWQVGDLQLQPAVTLTTALDTASRNDPEDPGETALRLITDLRRGDWIDGSGNLDSSRADLLQGLEQRGARLTVIDVGQPDDANLAVSELRCLDRLQLVDVPLRLEVEVANRGSSASTPTELTIEIDDSKRDTRPVPALRPGESTRIEIDARFATPGVHGIRAALPQDRFAPDDRRGLALDVRSASQVLVVDGDPGSGDADAETFFLQFALDPDVPEFTSGIDLRLIDDRQFQSLDAEALATLDYIVIANVSRLDSDSLTRLEQWVAAGGGLLVFVGDRVDAAHYGKVWWRGGQGPLAAALGRVRGDLDEPSAIHLADPDHPALARNTEELRFFLARLARIGRWFEIDVPVDAPIAVLLRVGDAGGPPLLVERLVGEAGGSVMLFGTTADALWTELPRSPAFPILVQELHAHAARQHTDGARNLGPADFFTVELDPALHRPEVTVAPFGDDAAEETTFAADTAATGGDRAMLVRVPMSQLGDCGLFQVRRSLHAGGEQTELLARNPVLAEGLLAPLSLVEFRAAIPAAAQERVTVLTASEAVLDADNAGAASRLWRWLGGLMLALLIAETLLLPRFGRR